MQTLKMANYEKFWVNNGLRKKIVACDSLIWVPNSSALPGEVNDLKQAAQICNRTRDFLGCERSKQ